MTNLDLEEKFNKLGIPLVGVFNKDTLKEQPVENGFYVINMQDSVDSKGKPQAGSHWVCFLVEDKEASYFDAFGFQPPEEVKNYLKQYIPFYYNSKQIQNVLSGVCGWYCLAFAVFMVENHKKYRNLKDRLSAFVSMFSGDVKKNKTILEQYIKPY